MSRPRKHFSAKEKVSILRRHLPEKVPISTLCEECGIQPSQFYNWQGSCLRTALRPFNLPRAPKRTQSWSGSRFWRTNCARKTKF